MLRTPVLLGAAALALAAAPIAQATHAGEPPPRTGPAPPMNLATGTGQTGDLLVHVNAQDRIPAANPISGTAWFQGGPSAVRQDGDPVCYNASLNRAKVGFFDRETGAPWTIFVQDNGEPGAGRDRMEVRAGVSCLFVSAAEIPALTVEQGNFVVHD